MYRMVDRVAQHIQKYKVETFQELRENMQLERIKKIARSFDYEQIIKFKEFLDEQTQKRSRFYAKFGIMIKDLENQFPCLKELETKYKQTTYKFFQHQFQGYYKKVNKPLYHQKAADGSSNKQQNSNNMLSQQNDFSNSEDKTKSINSKSVKTKETQQQQYLQDGEQILKKTKREESCDNDKNLDQEDKFILRYTGEEDIEDMQRDEYIQQNKQDKNAKKTKKNKQDDKKQNLDTYNVKVEQNEVEQQDEEVKENILQADKINSDSQEQKNNEKISKINFHQNIKDDNLQVQKTLQNEGKMQKQKITNDKQIQKEQQKIKLEEDLQLQQQIDSDSEVEYIGVYKGDQYSNDVNESEKYNKINIQQQEQLNQMNVINSQSNLNYDQSNNLCLYNLNQPQINSSHLQNDQNGKQYKNKRDLEYILQSYLPNFQIPVDKELIKLREIQQRYTQTIENAIKSQQVQINNINIGSYQQGIIQNIDKQQNQSNLYNMQPSPANYQPMNTYLQPQQQSRQIQNQFQNYQNINSNYQEPGQNRFQYSQIPTQHQNYNIN